MSHNSTTPNVNNSLVADVQQQSFLIFLGKRPILFSTLLQKLTLGWGKIYTRSELIKIINSLAKKGLVILEPRSKDMVIKPIKPNQRE